jgi:cell division protein FtsL
MNKKLIAALFAGAFAFASVSAFADDQTKAAPVDYAKLKAERDAARAKWAAMTPEQQAATRKAMQSKKVSELSSLELVAQDGGDERATAAESAQLKAERAAAKTKFDAMTPEQKAAMRKAAQQKKLSELSAIELISVHGQ